MNGSQRRFLCLALACGCLVALTGDRGIAQQFVCGGVGEIQIIADGRGVAVPGAVPGLDAELVIEGDAIGDPWWDEAEAGRPTTKPQTEKANENSAADPADAEAVRKVLKRDSAAWRFRHQSLIILQRELSRVRQSCPSLEKQQRALVLEAGRRAVDQAIDRAVEEEMQANGEMKANVGNAQRFFRMRVDGIETAIREALKAAVKANADDAALAAYEGEHRLGGERRKTAAVAMLVAEVDREAYLDNAEREALGEAFAASYSERWWPALVGLQQGQRVTLDSALPGVERCVEQTLGKERTAAWRKQREEAQKLAAAGLPGVGQMQMVRGGQLGLRVQRMGVGVKIQPAAKDAQAEAAVEATEPEQKR